MSKIKKLGDKYLLMNSLKPRLGNIYRLLTLALPSAVLFQALPVASTDIVNSASASGSNLTQPVTSNQTTVSAGTASLSLVKTGDRAAAEPGDTIIYRLALQNTGTVAASNIVITDTLPVGFRYVSRALQGSITTQNGTTTPVTLPPAKTSNRTVTFTYPSLSAKQTLNIVYAAVVTPDAVRGNGRNQAQEARSGIATYLVRIQPGILSDCGTVVGRVFVDKNFDGEQQPNEPGVPNAVIYMDDGNRIVTDANGLFSVSNVISGYRTLALDLSSLPGYTLAPNHYFIERNSQSRLVHLEPGGLVRANFGVTPVYGQERR